MKNFSIYPGLLALAATLFSCGEETPEPPACSSPPQIAAIEVVDAGCNAANGSLTVQASGGTGALMYRIDDQSFQASPLFEQLEAGSYTLEVKDENDCLATQEVELKALNNLSVSVASIGESGCGESEGTVELQAEGGEAGYSYSLDGENYQQEAAFTGLTAQEYTAHVKDASGCEETAVFTLKSGISYEASIKSTIETNCAVSGCHVAGTGRADFSQFSEIKSRATTIRSYTGSGNMPPEGSGKSLSSDEIAAIACWVNDGAPQN